MKLDDTIRDATSSFQTLREQMKLKLHLLGMEVKDGWGDVDQEIERIEGKLSQAIDAVGQKSDEAALQLHLALMEAKDRWDGIEAQVRPVLQSADPKAQKAKLDRARLQAHLAKMNAKDVLEDRQRKAQDILHTAKEQVWNQASNLVGELKHAAEELAKAARERQ